MTWIVYSLFVFLGSIPSGYIGTAEFRVQSGESNPHVSLEQLNVDQLKSTSIIELRHFWSDVDFFPRGGSILVDRNGKVREKSVHPLRSSREEFRLLAWHTRKICSWVQPAQDTTIIPSTTSIDYALVCIKFNDVATKVQRHGRQGKQSQKGWAVMILGRSHHSTFGWELVERADYPSAKWRSLQVFNHTPSNAEVYHFINGGIYPYNGKQIFSFDFNDDPTPCTTCCGESYQFVDGAVQTNTWKAVIGEAPTKFFPNGK